MSIQRIITDSQSDFVASQLQKFNMTDSALAELNQKYMPLLIKDLNDKEGYQIVQAGHRLIKGLRIDIDKRRRELTVDALSYQRAINDRAREITQSLEEIEEHLKSQEKLFENEKERRRLEAEAVKQRKFDYRLATIFELAFAFNGYGYKCPYDDTEFNNNVLQRISDEVFDEKIKYLREAFETYKTREAERLRAEQQALEEAKQREDDLNRQREQERLLAIEELRKKNLEEEERLKSEREKLMAEIKALEEAKQKEIKKVEISELKLPEALIIKMDVPKSKNNLQKLFISERDAVLEYFNKVQKIQLPTLVESHEVYKIFTEFCLEVTNQANIVLKRLQQIEGNLCQAN